MSLSLKSKKGYDYDALMRGVERFQSRYPFCEIFSIGKSVAKREIICIRIGNGPNKIFYNGAHHGAEWITSALLMKFIEEYLECYINGKRICDIPADFLIENVTLYVVPMVNPDGVDISINGARKYTADFPRLFRQNKNSSDFTLWQANFNGVDLNHNYDALWELSREGEQRAGISGPGPTKYAGETPFSEPETRAMKKFTEENEFKLTMSFHSQGREVYYSFNDKEPVYSCFVAKALTLGTPYIAAIPYGTASYGGYKDWFIQDFRRPGYTIEAGFGENPLPISQFDEIYNDNIGILVGGITEI